MDYFCYISRSKVDQLFQSFGFEDIDEITETETKEQEVGTGVNADISIARIFTLFKGGVTYGRKGVLQREKKVKLTYVKKLRQVLMALNNEQPILSFTKSMPIGTAQPDLLRWYHHSGSFRVEKPIKSGTSDKITTISTKVLSKKLFLDCSLRFFSEGNEPNDEFVPNSTTTRFFAGSLPLELETVFLVLGSDQDGWIGTPLFLLLLMNDRQASITL